MLSSIKLTVWVGVPFHHMLEHKLFVFSIDERKVALNAIKVWVGREVEYLCHFELLTNFLRLFCLMHLKVVQEDREISPFESCWQLFNKCNEFLCHDWLWMQRISFKSTIITDCSDECHRLNFDWRFLNFDACIFLWPSFPSKGVESKDCFIHINYLHFPYASKLVSV